MTMMAIIYSYTFGDIAELSSRVETRQYSSRVPSGHHDVLMDLFDDREKVFETQDKDWNDLVQERPAAVSLPGYTLLDSDEVSGRFYARCCKGRLNGVDSGTQSLKAVQLYL